MNQSAPLAPSLARVAAGNLCAGCGACAGMLPGRVTMTIEAPGFPRPRQVAPLAPEEDARVARTCPALGQRVEAGARTDSPLWGPYIAMMMGHATDDGLRQAGASGGALSGLLLHLLEAGEVDAVLQIAADPDLPFGNTTVISQDREGILAAAGSRYAPSSPLANLAAHVADGRRFAFVGKPCDAVAMAAIRAEDPEVARAFPIIVSFFCAGVPSFSGVRALLAALEAPEAELARFRYRGQGWPGRATATLSDGSERSMSYHDSWGKVLSKHVQHRCKICADGTGAAADIVCADAWESDAKGYPLFAEAPGQSLIVVRTPLGARVVDEAKAQGRLVTEPFDPARLVGIQPGQRERRRALAARLAALKVSGKPIPRYRGLRLLEAARQNPLNRNVRNFLGTLRRTWRPRRV